LGNVREVFIVIVVSSAENSCGRDYREGKSKNLQRPGRSCVQQWRWGKNGSEKGLAGNRQHPGRQYGRILVGMTDTNEGENLIRGLKTGFGKASQLSSQVNPINRREGPVPPMSVNNRNLFSGGVCELSVTKELMKASLHGSEHLSILNEERND